MTREQFVRDLRITEVMLEAADKYFGRPSATCSRPTGRASVPCPDATRFDQAQKEITDEN